MFEAAEFLVQSGIKLDGYGCCCSKKEVKTSNNTFIYPQIGGGGDGPSVIPGVGVTVGVVASDTRVITPLIWMIWAVSGVDVAFVVLVVGVLPSGFGEIVRLS